MIVGFGFTDLLSVLFPVLIVDGVGVEPVRLVSRGKARFEPIKCSSLQVRQCISHFSTITGEHIGSITEVEEFVLLI